MSDRDRIKSNIENLKKEIPSSCTLIAVSKYVGVNEIKLAYQSGQRDFGENRVPELVEKASALSMDCPDIRWHMIGRLQSNKLKKLLTVKNLIAIHSLFEKKHLDILNELCREHLNIFFQVNTSDEDRKGGVFNVTQVNDLIKSMSNKSLKFSGLMTMGKRDGTRLENLNSFKSLEKMARALSTKTSMGMSNDYREAISCGSDYVRIGSLIFK